MENHATLFKRVLSERDRLISFVFDVVDGLMDLDAQDQDELDSFIIDIKPDIQATEDLLHKFKYRCN